VPVDLEIAGGIAVVTLNDPDRRNALSADLVAGIVDACERAEADPEVAVLIVTGAGSAFCAGADLGDLSRVGEDGLKQIYEGFLRVARSPLPTIAAVNGPAVGAGMNLALACDVRVVAESGRFDTRFVKLGIHPGGGHTWMMRRLAGPQTTAAMVLFGEVVNGHDAVRLGRAGAGVPDAALRDRCRALAAVAAGSPPELVARVKQSALAVADLDDHDEAMQVELDAQLWSMTDPVFRQRLADLHAQISSDGAS
jgi:enoyl-CoA hydratase